LWKEQGISIEIDKAMRTNIPNIYAIVDITGKNRIVHATVGQPTQELREIGVRLMLNTNASILKNQRVMMIDDSLVQGTISCTLVDMVRKAGAKEVHLLISSPRLAYSCLYGIDMAKREKLITDQLDAEGIRKFAGADSVHYLTEKGLLQAFGTNFICLACFNGAYLIPGSNVCRRKLSRKAVFYNFMRNPARRQKDGINFVTNN